MVRAGEPGFKPLTAKNVLFQDLNSLIHSHGCILNCND